MNKELQNKVNTILTRVIKKNVAFTPEINLIDDLDINSLHLMELIAYFEDEFEIDFPVEKAINFRTIGEIYSAIENIDSLL